MYWMFGPKMAKGIYGTFTRLQEMRTKRPVFPRGLLFDPYKAHKPVTNTLRRWLKPRWLEWTQGKIT